MTDRFQIQRVMVMAVSLFLAGCSGSPTTPTPPTPPGPGPAPANAMPAIDGITIQGRRARQPARFADVRETVDVTATVRDAETPLEELIYQWTATGGTFSGTGRAVTWTAPDSAATPPGPVILTLKVIENYGHPGQPKIYSQEVTRTETLALHDSLAEVGRMSRDFLTRFSQPETIQDWRVVMQDFDLQGGTCPDFRQVEAEQGDVERHIQNFRMNAFSIGAATVTVAFGQGCPVPDRGVRPGDACATVPVTWDSTGPEGRGTTSGIDYISAAYSTASTRWLLCSSDYLPTTTLGVLPFYAR